MDARSQDTVTLGIVGCGPTATYALERLSAMAEDLPAGVRLRLHVFERTGEFGAGAVHSRRQTPTSYLNRIVGQVAFAADESVLGSGPLRPRDGRLTLHEWCRAKFAQTKDPLFDLDEEDWPRRYVHGMALSEAFEQYVEQLRAHDRVDVASHGCEVVDVSEAGSGFLLHAAGPGAPQAPIRCDRVLFATGHSWQDPARWPEQRAWMDFAARSRAVYVPHAYPLETTVPAGATGPGSVVGCFGMGLTALDVILYLTEGRGGRFDRAAGGALRYVPSGREPRSVVAFAASGLFTFARPYNAKQRDTARLQHTPTFFTSAAVDRLRRSVGRPVEISQVGLRHQLVFEHHVLPLLLLEMAHVYYDRLLGEEVAAKIAAAVTPSYEQFLEGRVGGDGEQAVRSLLDPVEAVVEPVARAIDALLTGEGDAALPGVADPSLRSALCRFLDVVAGRAQRERIVTAISAGAFGPGELDGLVSPTGHDLLAGRNRFSWARLVRPVPEEACSSPEAYTRALIAFMRRDELWAAQDNVRNPAKAAADGVWRDLRPVIAHAVDFGGLTADSHREFLRTYYRHHNRLANGACLEVMEKIRALVAHGILDVSVGPDPVVETDEQGGRFVVRGSRTGACHAVDVLVDAKVHTFDPEHDVSPLYRNLYRRGLVRRWRNPSPTGAAFEPGGLDLSPGFHPVDAGGNVNHALTFLGPPSEGVMFFQLGALRPEQNHHVMRDILVWLREFWGDLGRRASDPETATVSRAWSTAR